MRTSEVIEAELKASINKLAEDGPKVSLLEREALRCNAWRLAQELGLRAWTAELVAHS